MAEERDWARLDDLLDGALEQPREKRDTWLAEACPDDEALRARVRSLIKLAEDDGETLSPGGGLKGPLWNDVAEQLEADEGLSITPGSKLGSYEIRGVLGAGGMGRVYRAYDPGLDRDVAIKALFRDLSADEANLRRFEREAKLLATLSHPNIASIYGFHIFDGRPYLVLELVEGETLDEMVKRAPLSQEDAIRVARRITEALEEAHSKGIVHRDLKPSNVKVTEEGKVKVLDFGIARKLSRTRSNLSASKTLTQAGTILGTAAYMSPEQARGEPVDERTDIWALGCLLYEMLTGQKAFTGRTVSDLLASVLRDEVDMGALPVSTRPSVRHVLRRCLRKDPRQRFQHVGDMRLELEDIETGLESLEAPAPVVARPSRATAVPWALAAAFGVVAAVALLSRPTATPSAVGEGGERRFALEMPPGTGLSQGDYAAPMTLAPDGSAIVVLAEIEGSEAELHHRSLGRLDWTVLPGTAGAWQPFFSASGQEVGFFAQRRLRRVALDGTPPVTVTEVGRNPRGAAWAPDGTIVFGPSQTSGLMRVDSRGGSAEPLTNIDGSTDERSHRWPQVLPDGRTVLFTVDFMDGTFDEAQLETVSLDSGERTTVLRGGAHGRYVPSGHLIYAHRGQLLAAPFDAGRGRVTGPPSLVLDGLAYDLRNGGAKLAVARDGTLAYVPGPSTSQDRRLVWVDTAGRRDPVTPEDRRFHDPRLSPDGARVAVRIGEPASSDVWTLELDTGALSQVTFDRHTFRPTWMPDSTTLTVGVDGGAGEWRLVNVAADGAGGDVTLRASPNRLYPDAWSPDGTTLLFQERRDETGWDLLTLGVDEAGQASGDPRPVAATPANETNGALSPDGRFVAYESDLEDGLVAIYVQPLGRPDARVRASTGGGRWPHWGEAGQLFYWSSFTQQMRRVSHRIEADRFRVVAQELVWSATDSPLDVPLSDFQGRGFDLDPRAGRFLMLESVASAARPVTPRIVLAQGWAQALFRRPR